MGEGKMRCYRLLEITTTYEAYLLSYYKKNTIENLSYQEAYEQFVNDSFAESDYIHRYLKEMGIESKVIFYNNKKLQEKWNENSNFKTPFDIMMAQIKRFKPDVVYISDMYLFSKDELDRIRNYETGKVVKIVGFHFVVLNDFTRSMLGYYDQIYTGSRSFVELFQQEGINAKLLRHAFDKSVLQKVSDVNKQNKVIFPGNVFVGKDMHSNRLQMLLTMMQEEIPCSFYGNIYLQERQFRTILGKWKNKILYRKESEIVDKINGNSNHYGNIYGVEYYNVLASNLICINSHVPIIKWGAGNMRMFEATGMGTCLLTDDKKENQELFEIDKEIVTYANLEEFKDKLKWLMNCPNEAEKIGKAAQKKTLDVHTYQNKAYQLNEYIQELLTV
ncbi:MAG: glycosyltransferase [Lachnospiraceae bacterium]|nr:glycosyltransferase [Lachnospiraceae bacterium]